VLVAVISTFGRFTADGEMTILKASGIHPFVILPPALFLGVACACLTLYIHNDLVPRADYMRKSLLNEANLMKMLRARIEQSNRTYSLVGWDLAWHGEDSAPGSDILLKDVTFRQKSEEGKGEGELGTADSAELHVEGGLIVVNLKGVRSLRGRSTSVAEVTHSFTLSDSSTPLQLQHRTGAELIDLVRRIKRQGHGWFHEAEVVAHLHERLALSMACVVFVLLGVPVAMIFRASNRTVAFSLAFAIVIVFYYPMTLIGRSLATREVVDPAIAMWSGNALLSILGITLLMFVVRR